MDQRYIVLLLLSVTLGACQQSDVTDLKLGHSLSVNHSVHQAMTKMSEDLEKMTGGKMTITIYPNQQLGTERQCLELLQIGSLDMTKVSVGVMENFAPEMKVLGLPYIFRDKHHTYEVLDGPIGQSLLDGGRSFWLKGLAFYDAGSRSFYTKKKPVNSPRDLSGMKIRVMESVTAMDMVRHLGGSPTPISWGELYTSLQQGVVDGAENNPPSFYLSKHYEVCKYYSLDEHTTLPDVLVMSIHTWNRLTNQEKSWLKIAVAESVTYQRKLWTKAEEEALEAVEKAGVQISRPDKTVFKEMVAGIYDSYNDQRGMAKLIKEIREINTN